MEKIKCPNCGEKGLPFLKSIYLRSVHCENCNAQFGYNGYFWDIPFLIIISYVMASQEKTFLDNFHLTLLIILIYPFLTYKFRKMKRIYREPDPIIMTLAFMPFAAGLAASSFLFPDNLLFRMASILAGGSIFMLIANIDFKKRRSVKEEIKGFGSTYK